MDLENIVSIFTYLLGIAIILFMFYILWRFYEKANQPGWASLIPIYNMYILIKIAGRPGWWTVLYFIPLVNIIISFIIATDIAKAFQRSTAFGIFGLFLFSIIGYAMIAFGSDTYTQPTNA